MESNDEELNDKEIKIVSFSKKIKEILLYCIIASILCNLLSIIVFINNSDKVGTSAVWGYGPVNWWLFKLNCLIIGPINIIAVILHISIFNHIYTKSICKEKKKLIKSIFYIIVIISIIGFLINKYIVGKMEGWYIVHYYYYISFALIALRNIISKLDKAFKKAKI